MNDIQVSVVIPTYSRPDNLEKSIQSVITQDFPSFEVIVVDDNDPSTDARLITEKLMQKYSKSPVVRYIKHEVNKNGAAARNTGIFNSRGKYVAFLDDDDLFLPGHLKKEYEYLETHPEHSAVYCWRIQNKVYYKHKYTGNLSKQILTGVYCAPTSTLMFRKDALLDINGFDETYRRHQDLEIMLRFFEKYTVGVVEDVLLEMENSDGKNNLHGEQLLKLKDSFLNSFSATIDRMDLEKPGTKKVIICTNYSRVWADFIHRGPKQTADMLFKKYTRLYPIYFPYCCAAYMFKALFIKTNNKFKKSLRIHK